MARSPRRSRLWLLLRSPRALLRFRQAPPIAQLVLLLAVLYALSPLDLVPDVIPLFGVLDDAAILGFALAFYVRRLPEPAEKAAAPAPLASG